jgi:hypothetical protein
MRSWSPDGAEVQVSLHLKTATSARCCTGVSSFHDYYAHRNRSASSIYEMPFTAHLCTCCFCDPRGLGRGWTHPASPSLAPLCSIGTGVYSYTNHHIPQWPSCGSSPSRLLLLSPFPSGIILCLCVTAMRNSLFLIMLPNGSVTPCSCFGLWCCFSVAGPLVRGCPSASSPPPFPPSLPWPSLELRHDPGHALLVECGGAWGGRQVLGGHVGSGGDRGGRGSGGA